MSSPAYNEVDGKWYSAESAEDANYIRQGWLDLVPGTHEVPAPVIPQKPNVHCGTTALNGDHYDTMSMEDHYFVSIGRADLVPGCRKF
jgi:hypothetical protein